MDFITLAKHRYSSRKYLSKPIENEKLKIVLEAGRIAPSANNQQPWIFVVVKDENLENLRACYPRDWFTSAPMAIVLCADYSKSWKRKDGKDHADIDVAIAADHMTLAATSINLATCWICNFDREKLTRAINLPSEYEPVVILSLGYPDDEPNLERHQVKRKAMEEIVYYETFKPI